MSSIEAVNALNGSIRLTGSASPVEKKELTLKEKGDVKLLQQHDISVRHHEMSHLMTAHDIAISAPSFEYKRGPDGIKYAVRGEVNLDSSLDLRNPEAAIEKALKIQHAALAPADPSPKDMRVAAQARLIEAKAYRKLNREEIQKNIVDNRYNDSGDIQKNLHTILDLFS